MGSDKKIGNGDLVHGDYGSIVVTVRELQGARGGKQEEEEEERSRVEV